MSDAPIVSSPLSSAVAILSATAGLRDISGVFALPGGRNNRVYRVAADGRSFLLKEYFHHPDDYRDRGGTEFAFLRFAWQHGIRCIPEPIAWDPHTYLGLYEFVAGRKLTFGEVDESAVKNAAEFFVQINSFKEASGARQLPNASEACFNLRDHLRCVDQRIERLRKIPTSGKVEANAVTFIDQELSSRWSQVRATFCAAAPGGELDFTLEPHSRCLSPSDFGFHNALLTKSGICFLDFEYAGWDDPAKTVCDFFCQPSVPVPARFFELFAESVGAHSDAVRKRVDLLLPVYQIKWCCIVLNHFTQVEGERRSFAGRAKLSDSEKMAQLDKARSCLSALAT